MAEISTIFSGEKESSVGDPDFWHSPKRRGGVGALSLCLYAHSARVRVHLRVHPDWRQVKRKGRNFGFERPKGVGGSRFGAPLLPPAHGALASPLGQYVVIAVLRSRRMRTLAPRNSRRGKRDGENRSAFLQGLSQAMSAFKFCVPLHS